MTSFIPTTGQLLPEKNKKSPVSDHQSQGGGTHEYPLVITSAARNPTTPCSGWCNEVRFPPAGYRSLSAG
jgi:hypothetical protein